MAPKPNGQAKRKKRAPYKQEGKVGSKRPPSVIYAEHVNQHRINGRKGGRPSVYSDATANEICRRLSQGESIRAICRDDAMPGISTVMGWLFDETAERCGFSSRYERARKAQAEVLADEIVPIADDCDVEFPAAVNKARVQIDARRWAASVFNRSRFGDKPHVAIQNNNTAVVVEDTRELARRLALALTDATPIEET